MEIEIKIPQLDKILDSLAELRSELSALAKTQAVCACEATEPAPEEPPKKKGRGRKPKKTEPETPESAAPEPKNDVPAPDVVDDPFAELDAPTEPKLEITLDDIREAASKKMTTAEMRGKIINEVRKFVATGKIDQLKVEDYPKVLQAINDVQ